jgi:hypothetical protein
VYAKVANSGHHSAGSAFCRSPISSEDNHRSRPAGSRSRFTRGRVTDRPRSFAHHVKKAISAPRSLDHRPDHALNEGLESEEAHFKLETDVFKVETSDFKLETDDFKYEKDSFNIETDDFKFETRDFMLQTGDFNNETDDFKRGPRRRRQRSGEPAIHLFHSRAVLRNDPVHGEGGRSEPVLTR